MIHELVQGRISVGEGWKPEGGPGPQNLQSIPGYKMEKYHTVKIPTAIPSGKHAGASAMARWRTTAGVGTWREKETFREVRKTRAEKSVKGLEVSLCQDKGNLKLKSPDPSFI